MPQWRDFLERFRPAGTPGAAAQGGVPADRIADTAAELEPVFMMLDDVHAEAARIRRCAVEHADAIRQSPVRQLSRPSDPGFSARGRAPIITKENDYGTRGFPTRGQAVVRHHLD